MNDIQRRNAEDLVQWAELFALDEPTESAPITSDEMHMAELDHDLELQDALQNTVVVSEEVRAECLQEMAEAAQRGWKLRKQT
jgi:hypothetical protein